MDATALLEFVDAGHDFLLAVDSDASDELRELAADLGVDFDSKGSVITDHFNRYDHQHAGIMTSNALDSSIVFGSSHKHVSTASHCCMHLPPLSKVVIPLCTIFGASAGPCDLQRHRSVHLTQKHTGKHITAYASVLLRPAFPALLLLSRNKDVPDQNRH